MIMGGRMSCACTLHSAGGIVQTIGMQWEDYHGLREQQAANFAHHRATSTPDVRRELACRRLAVPEARRAPALRQAQCWLVLFALIGEIANQASIILAGSLTFTVVYSSVTIFTACLGILLWIPPVSFAVAGIGDYRCWLACRRLEPHCPRKASHNAAHAAAGLNGTAHLAAGFAVPRS